MSAQQGFPQLSAPIANVSAGGNVTQPWLQFFISLWIRTGAQQGGAIFNPGDLKAIAGATLPDGWLLCNGSAVSRSIYSPLFQNIGTSWGAGDGSSTFNVPNFSGKSLIGASASTPLASSGGTANVTLTTSNLPPHSHEINDPGHNHSSLIASTATAGSDAVGARAGNTGTSVTHITTNNTGSGQPFSVLPPYGVVQWIIKT